MNEAASDSAIAVIPARSERQAMDWSLVLASQDIPTTIIRSQDDGWALTVETHDHRRAREAIRQYRLENRRWGWRQPVPWSDTTFHWGGAFWCLLLALIHWITLTDLSSFRLSGRFDSAAVSAGQWWRAFTAILLHADLAHLLANMTIGFVLLGLAMARYGAGLALFAAYLAGAAGNWAGLLLYHAPYHGLGASGMVMGALGLIAVPASGHWGLHRHATKEFARAIFASVLLFVLLGLDPTSDVVAHLGGFVTGGLFGLGLSFLPKRVTQNAFFVGTIWFLFGCLFTLTGWLAWPKT